MAHLLGIDLGTTTTIVARVDEAGTPEIVRDWEGEAITPTALCFETATHVVVGREARAMAEDAEHAFLEFKRDMGTGVSHPVFGQRVTPLDLSALMLRRVRTHAEAAHGPVDLAVITIPANFTNAAREATLEAARRAGFKQVHMINEPTAAALAYARGQKQPLDGLYAVFDFGGGTFDVSLVRAKGMSVQVVFTEGVQRLGGKDFDAKLAALVAAKFQAETGDELRPGDCEFSKADAEDLKHRLSSRQAIRLPLRSAKHGRVHVEVTRAEFEAAIAGLVAQAEMACEGVLLRAGLDRRELAGVFLAGGTCRVPSVQAAVRRVFGQEPQLRDPDTAVALGAALYAAHKADPAKLSPAQRRRAAEISFQDIAPHYYGTLSLDDDGVLENSIIISKGEKLPVSRTRTYYTVEADQRVLTCEVTQSAIPENDPLMVLRIAEVEMALPPGRPADQAIEVTFAYDLNGIMRAEFRDLGTGQPLVIELRDEGAGRGSLNVAQVTLG